MQSWKPNYGEQTKQLRAVGLTVDDLKAAGFVWGRSQSWEGPETEEARQIASKLNGVIMAEFMSAEPDQDDPATIQCAAKARASGPIVRYLSDATPGEITRVLAPQIAKARAMGEKLLADAEKLNRPRLENTPKRFAQAQHARLESGILKRTADLLIEWACFPEKLPGWKPNKDSARAAVRMELKPVQNGYHSYHVEGMELMDTDNEEALALRKAFAIGKPEETPEQKEQRLIAAIKFSPIPGFFPTPPAVIERMIDALSLTAYEEVLEPSAGKGDIADSLLAHCVRPDVCEINGALREILTTKGHNIVGEDFMTFDPCEDFHKSYSKIIMNPPFERGQDREHIKKAFSHLCHGGRLVALCSASSPKNEDFAQFLDANGAEVEELPAGSFSGSDSFRQTGVSVCMITIDKN